MDRLSFDTLADAPAPSRPAYDPRSVSIGILHLGIGAFHRAHQATYTDRAIALGDSSWGIRGVTQTSSAVRDMLGPQNHLYSVLTRDQFGETLKIIGSVRDVISAPSDAEQLVAAFVDTGLRIVSLTITEKGYSCDASGALIVDTAIDHDLGGHQLITAIGRLAWGLDARRRAGGGPIAVMSCDNLARNGPFVQGAVRQFVERLPADVGLPLTAWIDENVTFPSSVVDRIVPATSKVDRANVERKLGMRDAGAIVTEPYTQWVIEGSFPQGRPRWPGVVETADIGPFQEQKLRLLNATHSALAYLGALGGFESIGDAIRQPGYREFAARLMADDAVPTLASPDGVDLGAYSDMVLERFDNPYLTHRCDQVGSDGSKKLPIRLLPSARDRLAAGADPRWICLAVAAWMRFLGGKDDEGMPLQVNDPMAVRLAELAACSDDPAVVVDRLLAFGGIFPQELAENERFRGLTTMWLTRITDHGVSDVLSALV